MVAPSFFGVEKMVCGAINLVSALVSVGISKQRTWNTSVSALREHVKTQLLQKETLSNDAHVLMTVGQLLLIVSGNQKNASSVEMLQMLNGFVLKSTEEADAKTNYTKFNDLLLDFLVDEVSIEDACKLSIFNYRFCKQFTMLTLETIQQNIDMAETFINDKMYDIQMKHAAQYLNAKQPLTLENMTYYYLPGDDLALGDQVREIILNARTNPYRHNELKKDMVEFLSNNPQSRDFNRILDRLNEHLALIDYVSMWLKDDVVLGALKKHITTIGNNTTHEVVHQHVESNNAGITMHAGGRPRSRTCRRRIPRTQNEGGWCTPSTPKSRSAAHNASSCKRTPSALSRTSPCT